MPVAPVDAYGHVGKLPQSRGLSAAASGVTTPGTVVPVAAGAGAGSSVAAVAACDQYGSFNVVTAGAPAAGAVAHVNFFNSYEAPPRVVQVTIVDITTAGTPATAVGYAQNVTSAGFDITCPALTTAHTYLVTYDVAL